MDTKLLGLILQGDKRIAREITDLKNTLSDAGLSESGAIVQTAAGESIVANDASDDGLKGLRVFGKSEQFSTTGKNLFNKDNVTYVPQISYNSNVYIKNGDTRSRLYYLPIEPNTDYYVSKTIGANLRVCVSSEVPAVDVKVSTINSNTSSSECVISSGTTGKYLGLYLLWSAELDAGMTYESVLDTVMVAKSNIAVPYEPYTGGIPSPNPNFPQPITSAGDDGDVEVGVYSGNLFNANSLKLGNNKTLNVSDDRYTITCTGGVDGAYRYSAMDLDVNELRGHTFCLSADSIVSSNSAGMIQLVVHYDNAATQYRAIKSSGTVIIQQVDDHVTRLMLGVYTNNNSTALATDNTITVKGLRVTLVNNVPWTPYKTPQKLTISTPFGLPGIKVTDASLATYTDAEGNMWCADEVDFERGVYVKRVGKMLLDKPSQFKTEIESHKRVYVQSNNIYNVGPVRQKCVLCDCLTVDTVDRDYICFQYVNAIYCYVGCTTYAEFEDFISNNPLTVQYILATPIETPLTNAELNAYKALHTNCPVTTILNDSGAHMELTYNADTKSYIDNKFTELTNAILSMGGNV